MPHQPKYPFFGKRRADRHMAKVCRKSENKGPMRPEYLTDKIPFLENGGPIDPLVKGGHKSENKGTDAARMPHRPKYPFLENGADRHPEWKGALHRKIRGRCGQNAAPTKSENTSFWKTGSIDPGCEEALNRKIRGPMRPECRTDQNTPFWKTGADKPPGRKEAINRKIRGRCGQNAEPTKIPLCGKRGGR